MHLCRVENGDCADACIAYLLSICPRSLIVSAGQLKEGLCSAAGYTAADEEIKQQAGPCDTLTLQHYKQGSSVA